MVLLVMFLISTLKFSLFFIVGSSHIISKYTELILYGFTLRLDYKNAIILQQDFLWIVI